MARSQHEGPQPAEGPDFATLWAEAAAAAGYAVNENQPLVGISGDEGDGFIVPLPAPEWFGAVTDEGARQNVFRALAAHALRVGQAAVKAADSPTREAAIEGVGKALNGGYKPGRDRSNDILDKESDRMFADHVRGKVLAAKPDASEKDVLASIEKLEKNQPAQVEKLRQTFRTQILERGTYQPMRKGGKAAGAVDIEL